MHSIWNHGYIDAMDGFSLDDNPYDKKDFPYEYEEWESGWNFYTQQDKDFL